MSALADGNGAKVLDLDAYRSVADRAFEPMETRDGETSPANVFLVESDPRTERSLMWMFCSARLPVRSFSNGRDFLDAVRDDDRGCVLLNIRLADADGVSVLEELASRRSILPVVLLSGYGRPISIVRPMGEKAGSADKPFDLAVLERVTDAMQICDAIRARRKQAIEAHERLQTLTEREQEVARMIVAGNANKVVAYDLDISERTVECHRARIMRKTQSESFADLVRVFAADAELRC